MQVVVRIAATSQSPLPPHKKQMQVNVVLTICYFLHDQVSLAWAKVNARLIVHYYYYYYYIHCLELFYRKMGSCISHVDHATPKMMLMPAIRKMTDLIVKTGNVYFIRVFGQWTADMMMMMCWALMQMIFAIDLRAT